MIIHRKFSIFKIKCKRYSLFYTIFIPISLIGILLIGGYTCYIYQKTYHNIQKNLVNQQSNYVGQVKNNLEQKIQTIEYTFSTYSMTNQFKQMLNQPLNPHNFEEVRKIRSELAYISVMGIDNTTNYHLISLKQGWDISHNSLKQLSKNELLQKKLLAEKTSDYIFWKKKDNHLEMRILLPIFQTERSAIGTATIPQTTIDQLLGKKSTNFFGIYDKNYHSLYQHNQPLTPNLQKKLTNSTKKQGTMIDDQKNIYFYLKSDYNHWTYVACLPNKEIHSSVLSLELGLTLLASCFIILFLIIAYLIASFAERPIREIGDLLAVDSIKGGWKSETKKILSGIDLLLTENAGMISKINKQKPELEKLFLLNLFYDQLTDIEIARKFAQFGYLMNQEEHYAIILIQIDDLGGRPEEAKDLFLVSLENIVSELIPKNMRFQPIILNQEIQATLLYMKPCIDKKKLIDYCTAIQQAAQNFLNIKINFGISNDYTEIKDSKTAVINAKEALSFRINFEQDTMIFFDDIHPYHQKYPAAKYSKKEEQELLDAMRIGEKEATQQYFIQVFSFILNENKHPIILENMILQLVNNLVQFGQLLGADMELLENSQSIYLEVLNKKNPFKVKEKIYTLLILPIVQMTQEKTDYEMRSLSEQMLVLLHKQYDQDISLEMLGEQLHYNPNYLSSVFKKEIGVNFGDYLQNYRLSISKHWLIETDLTIKDISTRLQYTNPQNFIRFFKKKIGTTPGEYRKQNKIYQ